MRPFPRQRIFSDRGNLLALSLMMTMIAGLFMTAWVVLAGTRAMLARSTEDASRRRLMMESTRAYARQMVQERLFSGNSTQVGTTGEIDSTVAGTGWGGLSLSGWGNINVYDLPVQYADPQIVSYPLTNYSAKIYPYNAFGLRPGAAFMNTQTVSRPASLNPADPDPSLKRMDNYSGYLFGKGIFPTLAGDAFIIYRKPERESGEIVIDSNFTIDGRLSVRDPSSLFNSATVNLGTKVRIGARSTTLNLQKADINPISGAAYNRITGTSNGKFAPLFQPTAGAEMMPSNIPATPSTFGPFPRPSGGAPTTAELYRGELNIIENTYVPAGLPASVSHNPNCLWQIQDRDATSVPLVAPVQTISVGTAVGTGTDPYWIEDQTSPDYPPPGWPSGYPPVWKVLFINLQHTDLPNLRIYGVVHQIVFLGQTTLAQYNSAATMNPRSIIVLPTIASQAVQDIRFVRENNRPFVLGVKGDVRQPLGLFWSKDKGGIGNLNASALTLDWRMILINEYRQITCNLPSGGGGPDSVILYGGVLTNWSFERYDAGAATKFTITFDPLAGYDTSSLPYVYKLATTAGFALASALPREQWLEPYFKLDP